MISPPGDTPGGVFFLGRLAAGWVSVAPSPALAGTPAEPPGFFFAGERPHAGVTMGEGTRLGRPDYALLLDYVSTSRVP